MVTTPILVFPDWDKTFHVNVDASTISLGAILAQPGERDLDHPIEFSSINLSDSEHNYNTTEREGLAMVYALQNFRHYLLGKHFKMLTDHSSLKYLVNKPVLGGRICRWLLLFQEFDFEVIVCWHVFRQVCLSLMEISEYAAMEKQGQRKLSRISTESHAVHRCAPGTRLTHCQSSREITYLGY
jgi:hypothetical protein